MYNPFHRLSQAEREDNIALLKNVTFIIKTFERPEALNRLLASIHHHLGYAGQAIAILVADDSREPRPSSRNVGLNVMHYPLPFDVGLSSGRNYLLSMIATDYLLLLDDDFVFTRHTDIPALYNAMQAHPEVDILAGSVLNKRRKVNYNCTFKFTGDTLYQVQAPYLVHDGLKYYDAVVNFFLAKTESVRKIRWKDELKTSEHTAFFLDCYRAGLICAELPEVSVLHRKMSHAFYNQYRRDRVEEFAAKFREIYNINRIVQTKAQ